MARAVCWTVSVCFRRREEKRGHQHQRSRFCMGKIMKTHVDALIQQIQHGSPDSRREAVRQLGNMETPADRGDVIQGLIQVLEDEDVAVREAAEEALTRLGGRDVIQSLILCLSSPSTTLLNAAIEILSRIGYAAIDPIRALLESKDHDIRKFGCDILGNLRHAEAVYDLIDLLNDPHVNVAIAAGEALGKIGNSDAVPYLIRALHHPDTWMKCIAAEALGKIGDQRAITPFIEMSAHEDPIVLYTVIKAMGNLRDERVLPYILSILQANPIFAPSAVQAIHTLATVKGDEIYDHVRAAGVEGAFMRLLQSENLDVLKSAINLVGHLHLTQAVQQLGRFLEHRDAQVVTEALHALLRMGEPGMAEIHKAMPTLYTLMNQMTDPGLQNALQHALSGVA
ncbi:PBS lyase HEAT domain protein repeat-containing protein [Candidatus Vecturithrix granuli]|uniref:PBS lyase HEAT domain protein repeat-containing protein n=1 Tax=Vecturithrix granuli TaxID=1499967 RepID=A0A081BU11_VECG1|nr:PBS lyase HEAT domain protein repeat-containing protein [Candidatus Vecturithrix granuli]